MSGKIYKDFPLLIALCVRSGFWKGKAGKVISFQKDSGKSRLSFQNKTSALYKGRSLGEAECL